MTSPNRLDEFGLIARYLAPLATHPGADGLRDDVAVLNIASLSGNLVITTDAIISGVHFLENDDPSQVAERLLRANLSDLAAKCTRPLGYQLTLAMTAEQDAAWMDAFARGLQANQQTFGWSLLGGDTVRTPGPLTLSLTAIGEACGGSVPRRGGGRVGDDVWVTGWIGDGALGLAVAKGEADFLPGDLAQAAERKFRLPQPRVAFGMALGEANVATASADVSDGLAADLGHICRASGISACVTASSVPLSPAGQAAVAQNKGWLQTLLTGGDDYEVIFTVSPEARDSIALAGKASGTPVHRIGRLVAGSGLHLLNDDGSEMTVAKGGYTHL